MKLGISAETCTKSRVTAMPKTVRKLAIDSHHPAVAVHGVGSAPGIARRDSCPS
jgi:hypothetical protein